MADEKNSHLAKEFLRALRAKHVEQVLSLFQDDGVWIAPEGTFAGKARMANYLEWQFALGEGLKLTECGNGVVVQANRAFVEHSVAYRRDGERIEYIVLCSLEMKDGMVARIRTVYDRLSIERQAARSRLSRWAVNRTVKQAEKGLRWPR